MLPSGHLGVAYVLHRFAGCDLRVLTIAVLFPDLVDKPLKLLLHVVPDGRTFAHGLPALILVSGLFLLFGKYRYGYSWFVGHLSHLLADVPFSSAVPWLYPFRIPAPVSPPENALVSWPVHVTWPELAVDSAATAVAVCVYLWGRRGGHKYAE